MATESFTNTDGTELFTHSANWVAANALSSDFIIDTNALRTPLNRNLSLAAYYSGTFANNQYATATITQVSNGDMSMGVAVRASSGNYYYFQVNNNSWGLRKSISFSLTDLATGSRTTAVNDVLYLEAVGSTITAKINGSQISSVTDTAITSGNPGVCGQGTAVSATYTLLDNWTGAEFPKPAQTKFRWRKDDGTETTATWASSENNNVVAPLG